MYIVFIKFCCINNKYFTEKLSKKVKQLKEKEQMSFVETI